MTASIYRAMLLAGTCLIFSSLPAAELDDAANYEFVTASQDRVWRLNKQTGEIAVCSLVGTQLLCTSSDVAMAAPTLTYADYQNQQTELASQREARAAARRNRDRAMLEKFLGMVGEMARAGGDGQ